MRKEGLLRRLDGERDKRYNERRRGNSDLEWGNTTDDDGEDVAGVGKEVVNMNMQGQEPDLDADMERVLGMLEKGRKGGERIRSRPTMRSTVIMGWKLTSTSTLRRWSGL